MSKRLRNLILSFGVSFLMWALLIQGGQTMYDMATSGTDPMTVASVTR